MREIIIDVILLLAADYDERAAMSEGNMTTEIRTQAGERFEVLLALSNLGCLYVCLYLYMWIPTKRTSQRLWSKPAWTTGSPVPDRRHKRRQGKKGKRREVKS